MANVARCAPMGVTNHFRMGFEPTSQKETHSRYYKSGQEPMVGKFTSLGMNFPLLLC